MTQPGNGTPSADKMPVPAHLLPWDSDFFGLRIGRVDGHTMDDAVALAVDTWAADHEVECVYFLADMTEVDTVHAAERHSYHFMDVRHTLRHDLRELPSVAAPPADVTLRLATGDDVDGLAQIARTAYPGTRFYADSRFDRQRVDDLYERWLRVSLLEGYADLTVVATQHDAPVGYVTVRFHAADEQGVSPHGEIGLVGVAGTMRGRGVGQLVTGEALRQIREHGYDRVLVPTQGRQAALLRFYERLGFVSDDVAFWYHKWYTS